jgi:hypothetical protein
MSSQCRDRTITHRVAGLIQVGRNLNSFTFFVNLDMDVQLAQNALEALEDILVVASILLHAKQEAVQNRIVAGLQALFGEYCFVGIEERAG